METVSTIFGIVTLLSIIILSLYIKIKTLNIPHKFGINRIKDQIKDIKEDLSILNREVNEIRDKKIEDENNKFIDKKKDIIKSYCDNLGLIFDGGLGRNYQERIKILRKDNEVLRDIYLSLSYNEKIVQLDSTISFLTGYEIANNTGKKKSK